MALTTYTEQQAWNVLAGNSPTTQKSAQVVLNNAIAASPLTEYTEQEAINLASSQPLTQSDQLTIWNNVKSALSLSAAYTQYTVQEMLNLAITAGLTLNQVLGIGGGGGGNVGLNLFLTLLGP